MKTWREGDRYRGGLVPFGFALKDGALVADVERQQTISRILDLYDDGHGRRRITAILISDGEIANTSTVRNILRRHNLKRRRLGVERSTSKRDIMAVPRVYDIRRERDGHFEYLAKTAFGMTWLRKGSFAGFYQDLGCYA